MATAIGLPAIYPTGVPLLSSQGGPFDGENVADAISQLSALLPAKPDNIGFNNPVVNTGVPVWGNINSQLVGAFSSGSNVVFSKYLVAVTTTNFVASGMVFPADRGVLALYKTTTDSTFASGVTLVAALNLGGTAIASVPPTNPSYLFNEGSRTSSQPDYSAPNTGIDLISLTWRLPYKSTYGAGPYTGFSPSPDFPAYQLATYTIQAQTLTAGNAGSFILVHWKETFATSLSAIQPANLLTALTTTNCYSAVPTGGNFDGSNVVTLNRRNVYRDSGSAIAPSVSSFAATLDLTPLPNTGALSGVAFITNSSSDLNWDFDIQVTNLFNESYLTGTATNVNILTGYESANNPAMLQFGDFGGGSVNIPYYDIRKLATPPNYSPTVAPQIADVGQILKVAQTIPSASPYTPTATGGIASLKIQVQDPFQTPSLFTYTGQQYLFNSYPQTMDIAGVVNETIDSFVSERYRYLTTTTAVSSFTTPILPTGGDIFPSASLLTSNDLQVVAGRLVYPQTDYSVGTYYPTGQPNYATLFSGDASNHVRRYLRVFNTGAPTNTGRIRLRGLAHTAFKAEPVFTGNEITDHQGGAIVQLRIPGVTPWQDLGRGQGDNDGCASAAPVISGPDVTVPYLLPGFTGNNGAGAFPVFIRISFYKGNGTALVCDEIEWLPL
jgi:hypothetical protein